MQKAKESLWQETELTNLAKASRFAFALCLFILGTFFVLHPTATVSQNWLGWSVSMGLVAVGAHNAALVFRQRLFWNEEGIFVRGVFGDGALRRWRDLERLSNSMQHRATIMTFRRYRSVKLYWSFRAYREIMDIAERRLSKHARTP